MTAAFEKFAVTMTMLTKAGHEAERLSAGMCHAEADAEWNSMLGDSSVKKTYSDGVVLRASC